MSSRRSLGGGRVLGSGKNLAPPPPAPPASQSQTQPAGVKAAVLRSPGLLSPSESSVSLSSQTSESTTGNNSEDITSRVAVAENGGAGGGGAGGGPRPAGSGKMVCPICNEEMVTLLQLNRHIDDNHANLEEVEQEQAKNWFEQQMKKAKKFQPLQMLNQKLRGLEVFESNNDIIRSQQPSSTPPIIADNSRGASPAPYPAPTATASPPPDPDDIITRTHWQRPTPNDTCSDPLCGKRLNATNGQIHCRHCGKLFCEEHTMYQMKLSRSANHEPVRGLWYRVCETCYKTRVGYNDCEGSVRDHGEYFKATRRKVVDKANLESSRLETRLTRLTQLLADPPPAALTSPPPPLPSSVSSIPASVTNRFSLSNFTNYISGTTANYNRENIRALEQSVVAWEDDKEVAECPFCQQPFSQYGLLRRHHCRTCGRVVCGDAGTRCSWVVGLDVAKKKTSNKGNDPAASSEKAAVGEAGEKVAIDVRMCKDCHRTIFSKPDFLHSISTLPPSSRAYANLIQFEQGIQLLLPKFHRLLQTLQQDPESSNAPTSAQLAEAGKVRKRLTDAFTQYDVAARRIRDLDPGGSETQKRLQEAVWKRAVAFLHVEMLTLKSVPKVLREGGGAGRVNGKSSNSNVNGGGNYLHQHSRNTSTISTATTAGSSSIGGGGGAGTEEIDTEEEKELRERLIVLEEQKFMVDAMVADANKRRKFDEADSLARNVDDLRREIEGVRGRLGLGLVS